MAFLAGFKKLIEKHVRRGARFVIIVGGGSTCRQYQQAARDVGTVLSDDLDWLGIHATRLNGHLLRTIFRRLAHPVMIKDPTRPLGRWHEPVLIAAGWKPGWSTDYVAMRLAKRLKAETVINLTNVDYVYDKDPRAHADAKPIREIDWPAFRKMVGDAWDPGMHVPFDPIASRLAQQAKKRVVMINGRNLENLDRFLSGKTFTGTVVG